MRITRINNNLLEWFPGPAPLHPDDRIDRIVAKCLDEDPPDLVHVHHLFGLSTNLPELFARKGVPFGATLHDLLYLCPKGDLLCRDSALGIGPPNEFECSESCGIRFKPRRGLRLLKPLLVPWDLYPRWMTGLGAGFARRRFARTISRSAPQKKAAFFEPLRRFLGDCAFIVAPSVFVRDAYAPFVATASRIRVLPHAAPPLARRSPAGGTAFPLTFGYLGVIHPGKGVDLLLEAARLLDPEPKLRFELFGPVHEPSFRRKFLREIARLPNIRYRGPYAWESLPRILAGIDVLVVPSRVPESYGYVAMEANLAHVPVLAADAGALPEIVEEGANGWLFRRNNAAALADRIRSILDSPVPPRRRPWKWKERTTLEAYASVVGGLYAAARNGDCSRPQ